MEAKLLEIVQTVNSYLTDYVLIILLIGIGLFYTIRTRFVQVRCFPEAMKRAFGGINLKGGKQEGGLSAFQALATAIAAQVGTGNIVGACGAIILGGPGAIFWMWVIAFFGMATIYSEAVLAQETRVVNADGSVEGGPVYYITKAFKGGFGKFLAGFFAVATILALGFMGSMVQSNSIGENFEAAFNVPSWAVGIVVAFVAGFIFIGGANRIASVTEKIVPIMAAIYLIGCIIVLVASVENIPGSFALIFKSAFSPAAAFGGAIGFGIKEAISQGAKRGLFSNEAGMGSTPHAHALAKVEKPHDQGVLAMAGVFIDTFVVLTMTALVVISTLYVGENAPIASGNAEMLGYEKTSLAQIAFSTVFGDNIGGKFVAICLLFFAFSTIIGWNLFGKVNAVYLFGKKSEKIYAAIAVIFVFLGSCLSNNLVWELTDMFNYLMVLPNVLALALLSGIVVKAAKSKKAKKEKAKK